MEKNQYKSLSIKILLISVITIMSIIMFATFESAWINTYGLTEDTGGVMFLGKCIIYSMILVSASIIAVSRISK